MRGLSGKRAGASLGLLALCVLCAEFATQARAQQGQGGGLRAGLTYSEQLVSEDSDTNLRSDIGFTLSSITRRQRFSLELGTGLEKRLTGGSFEGDVVDPRVQLSYGIENRNTALNFDAAYREATISRLVLEENTQDVDPAVQTPTLVLDEGRRGTASLAMGLEFGRASRFGGTARLRHVQTRYSDTRATGLVDSDQRSANLNLRFNINPQLTGRAILSLSEIDRDGATDTRTRQVGIGAGMVLNKTLTADVEIGINEVTQSGAVPRNTRDGVYYRLALTQERPNGTLSGSLTSDFDQNGRRTSLRIDRSLSLPEAQLRFSIGASRKESSGGVEPLFGLSYDQNLPRGSFSADLEQRFGSDTLGGETRESRLRLGFTQELSEISRLSTNFSLRDTDSGSGLNSRTRQTNIGFDYSRNINRDWALFAGFAHSRQERNGGARTTDDRLFVGVRLTRDWKP